MEFGELSGAEDEKEGPSPKITNAAENGPSSKDNAAESSVSTMSKDSLDTMKNLLKQLGKGNQDCASESSSEGGSVSGGSSEETDLEDMFKVEVLPRSARSWLTSKMKNLNA